MILKELKKESGNQNTIGSKSIFMMNVVSSGGKSFFTKDGFYELLVFQSYYRYIEEHTLIKLEIVTA